MSGESNVTTMISKNVIRDWRVTGTQDGKISLHCQLTNATAVVSDWDHDDMVKAKIADHEWRDEDRVEGIIESLPRTDERSRIEQYLFYQKGLGAGMWWGWAACACVGFSISCWINGHFIVGSVLTIVSGLILLSCWAIRK